MRSAWIVLGAAWQLMGCSPPLLLAQDSPAAAEDLSWLEFEAIAAVAEELAQDLHRRPLQLLPRSHAPFCPEKLRGEHLQDMQQQFEQALESASLRGELRYETQNIKYRDDGQRVQVMLYVYEEARPETAALLLNLRHQGEVWQLDLSHYCAEALLPP